MRSRFFMRRWLVIAAGAVAVTGAAHAAVFKCKGADGTLVLQDSACGPSTQALHPAAANDGPPVNLSLPLDQRVKNPHDKRRLDAAVHITGLQSGLRKRIEHCQKHAPKQVPVMQSLLDGWRSERAAAIAASERLMEKYLTATERVDALAQFDRALSSPIEMSINSDPAVNANNCKSAALKMRQFMEKRYAGDYTTVVGAR